MRIGIRRQLNYIRRNLGHIDKLIEESYLGLLSKKSYRDLLVIHELYRQQKIMYENKVNSIEDRIVNISQPHIRPIVRGKMGKNVEFGSKVSISCIAGFSYIDKIS